MRLLKSSLLCLSACALALSAISAEAKPKAQPTTAKKAASAQVIPAANSPAVTGRNTDGSLRTPILEDAPSDDFLKVAWCHGILSGNMEIAEMIDSVAPVDDQIQKIGMSYLRSYEAALTLSGRGKDEAQHKKAEQVRDYGYNQWSATRAAPPKEAAFAYANWQLPGECEHAAVRLSGHPNLFAEMATDEEATAIAAALSSGGPHNYEELPKPILTAQSAPVDGDAPVSSNTLARRVTASSTLPSVPDVKSQGDGTAETTLPTQTANDPNHVEKRKWSDGLGYRLGWSNTPKKKVN
ncbi:hypothetical protein AEAC466_03180 [Asticcacaulis sp. AC466]|uniref:hypothetical protein n=1 Tax=Asticcacaulis sp. AC466 TaxID=1282362 RepID=UPI0003C407EB|nr:hypothetical protein [Asticcacaulis sp. AC466]ESQ86212.1 hypothetical protein AEAC466_03180 [Asticcacaulis sp. AC466]